MSLSDLMEEPIVGSKVEMIDSEAPVNGTNASVHFEAPERKLAQCTAPNSAVRSRRSQAS